MAERVQKSKSRDNGCFRVTAQGEGFFRSGANSGDDVTIACSLKSRGSQIRITVKDKINTVVSNEIDITGNGLMTHPERGDDVTRGAAGRFPFFIHRYGKTGFRQKISSSQTAGTGTDNSSFHASVNGRLGPLAAIFVIAFQHSNPFCFPDQHRSFIIKAGTVILAGVIADMAGDGRESVFLIDQSQGFGVALLAHQTDIFGDVLVDRAGLLAWRYRAVIEGQLLFDSYFFITAPRLLRIVRSKGFFGQGGDFLRVNAWGIPAVHGFQFGGNG